MGNTPNRNYPLPVVTNNVSDDVAKLQTALSMVDGDVDALFDAINTLAPIVHAHAIADVTGLQGALDGKAAFGHVHALDNLTDVSGAAGAADGYILWKTASGWVPVSPAAALGVHGHTIAQVTGLQSALDAKALGVDLVSAVADISNYLDRKASLLDVRRNRMLDPGLFISQENGFTAAPNGAAFYVCDAWKSYYTTDAVLSNKLVAATSPDGTPNQLHTEVTVVDASLGAGDFNTLEHIIEGREIAEALWGTADAKPIVFRFWAKAPRAFALSFRSPSSDVSYVVAITPDAADTDQLFEIAVPGPTTGTWPEGDVAGLYINIVTAAGTTYQTATAGAWIAANAIALNTTPNGLAALGTYRFSGFGFRIDPDATGAYGQFEAASKAEAKLRCRRYWWQTYDDGVTPGTATSVSKIIAYVPATCNYYSFPQVKFSVPMRTKPAVTIYRPSTGSTGAGDTDSGTVPMAADSIGTEHFLAYVNNSSVSANVSVKFHATANARMG